jgi:hypothetical protein
VKCDGCGLINVHEALFCEKCGKTLEDWNAQSRLRKEARSQGPEPLRAPPPLRMPSKKPGRLEEKPSTPRPPAPIPSPRPRPVQTVRASTFGSAATEAKPREEASHGGGFDPWASALPPQAPPTASRFDAALESRREETGRFTAPTVPGDLAVGEAGSRPEGTAASRLTYYVAVSHLGIIKAYVLYCVSLWLITTFQHSRGLGPLLELGSVFGLIGGFFLTLFHGWRLASAQGCGALVVVLAGFLFIPYVGVIAVVVLVLSTMTWLDGRGAKVGFFGPDGATLARLKKQAGL